MQNLTSNQINLLENAVPRVGDTLADGNLVMNVDSARIVGQGEAMKRAVRLLTAVCKEYSDIWPVGITDTKELRTVAAMTHEGEARNHVAAKMIAAEGQIKLGGLTLSAAKVAELIDVKESQELIKANNAVREFFKQNSPWGIESFQLVDGVVTATEGAQRAVLYSCMALTTDEKAKKVFAIAKRAEKVLRDLEALYPDRDRSAVFLRSLDEYFKVDNETGKQVVNGEFIKWFTEPQISI